jgi:beta-lactamase class A
MHRASPPVTRLLFLAIAFLPSVATAQRQQQPATPLGRLQANIERIAHSVNAKWGIYVKCVENGDEIAINADEPMDTMSVIKIPIMVEAYRQIEAGKFSLTDRVSLKDSDKRGGTGTIQDMDAGLNLTIKDLITMMIVVSDNTATDLLLQKVGGPEAVNQLMREYGLPSIKSMTTVADYFKAIRAAPSFWKFQMEGDTHFGLSSPRDMGKLLEKIHRGEAVSKKASAQMLEIMRRQVYSSRLPKYVTGFEVPHKTGDFPPFVANDVGILESTKYHVIICVFDARHDGIGPHLEDAVARISEQVANYYNYKQ